MKRDSSGWLDRVMLTIIAVMKVGFGRHTWDIRALTLLNAHNSRVISNPRGPPPRAQNLLSNSRY